MNIQLSFTDYDGFCNEFIPKKTTDDCHTPPAPTNKIWNQQETAIAINKIYKEDCLEGMKRIPDKSVDMVLCDLPYGTTMLEWDICIPLDKLWKQWLRVCKQNAAIVLFSAQPFTTDLINSNRKMFRYEIIWKKSMRTGYLNAKKMPLRIHENILVFYKKLPTYNPIMTLIKEPYKRRIQSGNAKTYNKTRGLCVYENKGTRYPTDVIEFSNWNGSGFNPVKEKQVNHPTSKPVDLCEYLIKTYTNDGDVVLDSCIGSGTTAVAAINTNRNFIGFELDSEYYKLANQRIGHTE